jgi:hypothetical protein
MTRSGRGLFRRLYVRRRQRLFSADQLTGKLVAHNRQFGRRLDAKAHSTLAQLDHRHGDLVANENPLADFATQN